METPALRALLWGGERGTKRGPKPSMSVEQIVTTAVETADAEGLAGLSMQRLAEQLGVSKMSLYRYLPGRVELIALMLEAALGPAPDLTTVRGGWRPKLRAWGLHQWEVFRLHPWGLEVAVGARILGPNELAWLETALAGLSRTRLTPAECLDTVALIGGHVRGILRQELGSSPHTALETELTRVMADVLSEQGHAYPNVAAAFVDEPGHDQDRDDALAFGLDRILDGIAALNDRRRPE